MTQLTFAYDTHKPIPTGRHLRDRAIQRVIDHAGQAWQKKALSYLESYARTHHRFSGEMVRQESRGIIESPPSLRSWGAVLLQGSRKGWIRRVGYVQVSNPKAHACFASEWESLID